MSALADGPASLPADLSADLPSSPVQGAAQATAVAVAVDTPVVRQALNEIAALLLDSDMGALEHFAVVREVLGALPAGALDDLEEALQSLDFEKALAACQVLLLELEN